MNQLSLMGVIFWLKGYRNIIHLDSFTCFFSFKAANCDESRICLAKADSTSELLPELLSTYIMLLDDELHGKSDHGKGNCYVPNNVVCF